MLAEIFRRPRPGAKTATEVTVFHVTVHHKGAAALMKYNKDGRVESTEPQHVTLLPSPSGNSPN